MACLVYHTRTLVRYFSIKVPFISHCDLNGNSFLIIIDHDKIVLECGNVLNVALCQRILRFHLINWVDIFSTFSFFNPFWINLLHFVLCVFLSVSFEILLHFTGNWATITWRHWISLLQWCKGYDRYSHSKKFPNECHSKSIIFVIEFHLKWNWLLFI